MSDDMTAEFARAPEIIDYGRYAMQIRPWIDAYGRDACI
jgi:hypothetical protein